MHTIHTRITGRVQGVFFRDSTRKQARMLGLRGWVKNVPDGSVEAVFQGEKEELEEIQKWLNIGPPHAKVEKVTVSPLAEDTVYDTFQVLF